MRRSLSTVNLLHGLQHHFSHTMPHRRAAEGQFEPVQQPDERPGKQRYPMDAVQADQVVHSRGQKVSSVCP